MPHISLSSLQCFGYICCLNLRVSAWKLFKSIAFHAAAYCLKFRWLPKRMVKRHILYVCPICVFIHGTRLGWGPQFTFVLEREMP